MNEANIIEEQPTITFLNMTGDITIEWDKENEQKMLELVEEKMKAGYTFFILKKRLKGLVPPKKMQVSDIKQVKKAGGVTVINDEAALDILKRAKLDDPAVEAAVSIGAARLVSDVDTADTETERRARTAKEVVSNRTIAVRPIQGG